MPFDHSFGGRARLRPHVVWKCTPDNPDVCSVCEQKPQGDYYFSGLHFLCRPCYGLEWNRPSNYTRRQLEAFKKIRDCVDIHRHNGTSAAYPLMSDKDIRKLRILECYFASYEGALRVVNTEPGRETRQSRAQDGHRGRRSTHAHAQLLLKHAKH